MDIDLSALGPAARRVLAADAPGPLRMMGAKGMLPGVPPGDLLTVIVALSTMQGDPAQATASLTLSKLPRPILDGALAASLSGLVVRTVAEHFGQEIEVLPRLLAQAALDSDTLCEL